MLVPGLVTTIGSLPHVGVEDAVRFALDGDPELPAAPQLPGHDPAEGMLAQVAVDMPGVTVDADGRLTVDRELMAGAMPSTRFRGTASRRAAGVGRLDPVAFAGTLAFLEACGAAGRRGPVKLQLAGPVTLGIALVKAGLAVTEAYSAALDAVMATATDLLDEARSILPGVAVSVWLDEPGLVAATDLVVAGVDVTGLLRRALGALGPDVVAGVHCCGATDWRLVTDAGPTVLSMPVDIEPPAGSPIGPTLDAHLRRGGWIAWGAVPTDRPVSLADEESLWQKLLDRWAVLASAGCDPVLLRRQAIVTPACGLAGHTVPGATTIVELTRRLGHRVAATTA